MICVDIPWNCDIFRLAELQTEVELFRGAIYSAVDAMMAGQNVTLHASMIKLKAGRLCRYVNDIFASKKSRELDRRRSHSLFIFLLWVAIIVATMLKGNSRFVPPILGRHGIHERRLRVEAVQRLEAVVNRRRSRRGHAGNYLQVYGDASTSEKESMKRGGEIQ